MKYFKKLLNFFVKKNEQIQIEVLTPHQQLQHLVNITNEFMKDIFKDNNQYTEQDYYLFGGSIRDTLHNKYELITDLDIYIPTMQEEQLILFQTLQTKFENVTIVDTENLIDGYINKYITSIIKIKDQKLPYDVDLVFGDVNINEFLQMAIDFNICKIALNTQKHNINKSLIITDEYLSDSNNKKITFDNSILGESGYKFSIKTRLPKILKKYPNFEFDYNHQMYPISISQDTLFSTLNNIKLENKIHLECQNLELKINSNLSKTNKSKKI